MGARWIGIGLAFLLLACGSEQSKLERGAVVDEEVAVPSSDEDLALTESERRAREEREEQRASREAFEEDQRENAP